MKLRIKWSNLTDQQREQASSFYKEAVEDRKMILNQQYYFVNASTGQVMFFKDF